MKNLHQEFLPESGIMTVWASTIELDKLTEEQILHYYRLTYYKLKALDPASYGREESTHR